MLWYIFFVVLCICFWWQE